MNTVVFHLFLKCLNTSDTHTIDHANTVLVDGLKIHAAVVDGLLGGYHGQLCVAVHLTSLLAVQVVVHIEVLHLAGKLGLEVGGIETCNSSSTTDARNKVFPCFLRRIAYGGDGTETCYNNSF